jgi:hypothetical protein
MSDSRRVAGAAGGALGLGAFAALFGTCCVAPWTVGLLGAGGAIALARLSFLQPYLIAGTLGLLGIAFWWAYRPQPACGGVACSAPSRRPLRWIVWSACLLIGALAVMTWLHRVAAFAAVQQ